MEAQTITCPNCGASTSGEYNCEYCGSFLVQKAHQGIDMTDYVQIATQYANPKVLKYTQDLVTKLRTNPHASVFYQIYTADSNTRIFEVGSNNDYKKDGYGKCGLSDGISVWLYPKEYGGLMNTQLRNRLKRTKLYKVFDKYPFLFAGAKEDRPIESIPESEVFYVADFGFDAEGAALVVSQLLSDVLEVDFDDVLIISEKSSETLNDNQESTSSGCLGMFAAVCTIGLSVIAGIGYAVYNLIA